MQTMCISVVTIYDVTSKELRLYRLWVLADRPTATHEYSLWEHELR